MKDFTRWVTLLLNMSWSETLPNTDVHYLQIKVSKMLYYFQNNKIKNALWSGDMQWLTEITVSKFILINNVQVFNYLNIFDVKKVINHIVSGVLFYLFVCLCYYFLLVCANLFMPFSWDSTLLDWQMLYIYWTRSISVLNVIANNVT